MAEDPPIAAYIPAAEAALAAFGMAGAALDPVGKSENVVFRVTDAQGQDWSLRLHRPGYHALPALESERQFTAMLAKAGLTVPTGRRTADGAWYARVDTPDPAGWRYAGLIVWHPGQTLGDLLGAAPPERAPHWYEQAGALLADLHNASAAWQPPAGFVRHSLDATGLVGEAPFWGRFWEAACLSAAERDLLTSARDLVGARLADLTRGGAPWGLIHADAHPGNLLLSEGRLGLIDFDDCAWGWHAFDMAVALFYARRQPQAAELVERFLTGYAARRALPADIQTQLALFQLMRALMLIGWCEGRPEIMGDGRTAPWKAALMADVRGALASLI